MTDVRDHIQYNPDTGSFKWIARGQKRRLYGPAGCYDKYGYLRIRANGVSYQAANLAWYLTHGEWPRGIIDHIDRNPSNNRLDNLRDVSYGMNMINRRRWAKTVLPRGVYRSGHGSYCVLLRLLGKWTYIGTYKTQEEATAVSKAAYKKQWELSEKHELERRKTPQPKVDLRELGIL